jgi:hypothetical protein
MVDPEQTSIARQRLGNHVSATTNIYDYFTLQRIAANKSLPGSKLLNKVIPVTTEELFDGDFHPCGVEVSVFVNSRGAETSPRFRH